MDIVSHILIGKIVSFFNRKTKKADIFAMLFSFLPDLTQIPFYIYLGFENMRPFLFPYNSDWNGGKIFHPFLTILWEIPHSFFFLFLIILPIVIFLKLPKIAFFAYFFHLLIDILTHSGEWAIKPFYPSSLIIDGFTNGWAWSTSWLFSSWLILSLIVILLSFFSK